MYTSSLSSWAIPPVFPGSGNNWKEITAHTWQLSLLRLKPAPPPNTDHDSEQSPKCTLTAEKSARTASQDSCTLGADHPGCCPAHDQPPSACQLLFFMTWKLLVLPMSAGNGSLITAKSLLIVKIRSTSDCRASSSKITGIVYESDEQQ